MANSEFGKDHGLLHEVVVTGRKVGAGEEFWAGLAHNEGLFARVVAFVAEAMRMIFHRKATIERNMEGWTCLEPATAEECEFEASVHEFLLPKEASIGGEEMVKRAKESGISSGLRDAEAMLRQQDKIPSDLRKCVLVFPEVWQSPRGVRNVWYLAWDGDEWYLVYGWLRNDFCSYDRLVGSRKYQKDLGHLET